MTSSTMTPGTGQQPTQPRRCCRKHEAEDLNGRIFGRLFIVCPTCQDKRCPHADDCANACSQQPAQPLDVSWLPMGDAHPIELSKAGCDPVTGQPAQPESGEVKRFEFVGRQMVEVAPSTTCGGTPFVMAADYDRLQAALAEAQRERDEARSLAFRNSLVKSMQKQVEAAQQRIAALHASLRTYGYHKPDCDYMQEELPCCTCGFLTAVECDFPEGA